MQRVHFILYVDDQARSRNFYEAVLGFSPRLDVPGMTEFELPGGAVLGLMPSRGIKKLLGPSLPDPDGARGVPRVEIYLFGESAQTMFDRALKAGATPLSPFLERDWGHTVGYCLDPDAHVVACAGTHRGEKSTPGFRDRISGSESDPGPGQAEESMDPDHCQPAPARDAG